jgi:PAS domain-containing protein
MSTRFYYPSSWTAVGSTAYTAIWSQQTGVLRRQLWRGKFNATYACHSISELTTTASAYNYIARQYISEPISGSQFINGYVRGVMPARSSSASQAAKAALRVFIVDSAMAVRGTLYTSANSGVGNAFNTALRNIYMPSSSAVTSLTTQNGDRLVVEMGFYPANVTSTAYYTQLWFGTPSSDCNYNETDTASYAPWIELNSNIMFQGARSKSDLIDMHDNDLRSKDMFYGKAESFDIQEKSLRSFHFTRVIAESIGIADKILKKLASTVGAIVKNILESVGLADASRRRMAMIRRSAEQIGATEKSRRFMSLLRRTAERLGIQEKAGRMKTMLRRLLEQIGLSDRSTRRSYMTRRTAEQVGVTEKSRILHSLFRRIVEAVGIKDKILKMVATAIKKVILESLVITEKGVRSLHVLLKKISVEVLAIADRDSRIRGILKTATDRLGMADFGLGAIITASQDASIKVAVRIFSEASTITRKTAGSLVRRLGGLVNKRTWRGGGS